MLPDALARYVAQRIRKVDPEIAAQLKSNLRRFDMRRLQWDAERRRRNRRPEVEQEGGA